MEFLGFNILGKEEIKYCLFLVFCQCMKVYLLDRSQIEATQSRDIKEKKNLRGQKTLFQKIEQHQNGYQGNPQDFILYFLNN